MHIHPANVGYFGSQPLLSAQQSRFPRHHLPEAEGADVESADFACVGVDAVEQDEHAARELMT